jgi:hypothetical protein
MMFDEKREKKGMKRIEYRRLPSDGNGGYNTA